MVLIWGIGAIWLQTLANMGIFSSLFFPRRKQKQRREKMTNALSCQIEILPHFTLHVKCASRSVIFPAAQIYCFGGELQIGTLFLLLAARAAIMENRARHI